MPLKRLKFTGDYTLSNIRNFIIILLLILVSNIINGNYNPANDDMLYIPYIIIALLTLITQGYGLLVTKDTMYNGTKLPDLKIGKSIMLGIKSFIIVLIYSSIQITVFSLVADIFDFPYIEIGEGTIHLENVSTLFYNHGSVDTILFAIFVIVVMYTFTFFMEISLARLADKEKLSSALNILSIGKCINTIGWMHYASDYTKLIIAIAILAYIKYGMDFILVDNIIMDLIIGVLIFIIQFIGIGSIYKEYKIKSTMQKIDKQRFR